MSKKADPEAPFCCIKSTENSIQTRRCFITGESCSQQTNIQKARKKLHSHTDDNGNPAPEINAFVVMNFSSISDVVYETTIKHFIESLKEYLYLDTKNNKILCLPDKASFSLAKDRILEAAKDPDSFLAALKRFMPKNAKQSKTEFLELERHRDALADYLRGMDESKFDAQFQALLGSDQRQTDYLTYLMTGDPGSSWKKVSKIHVHRADSNPVSHYIICNRICQQLQMADLVIVDVTAESANIFYEFGLATAFHKLILPICFSDSYYKMVLPEKLAEAIKKRQAALAVEGDSSEEMKFMPKKMEKHIDCFPWRRKLFEHFGIRRQARKEKFASDSDIDDTSLQRQYNGVRYLRHELVSLERYGFSDTKYNRFPYTETVSHNGKSLTTGKRIYTWLQESFNCAAEDSENSDYNTLIVYTMERIENKNEAGQCIINFYNNVTRPMWEMHCFCGDRVAILGQDNQMWDDPKDNLDGQGLPYRVSDLIRLGMNQATYQAEHRRIKTEDYMNPFPDSKVPTAVSEEIKTLVKPHLCNRALQLNPDNPVYVSYLNNGIQTGLQKDVVDAIRSHDKPAKHHFFCLYHVMLHTLRYANEIVVDLSSNSIQSLFWLGAAHGSDIYAITVRQQMTDQERSLAATPNNENDRSILDISGLWTAMLSRDEIAGFYKQLELIQQGIDQHTKLKLPESELTQFEENANRRLYDASRYPFSTAPGQDHTDSGHTDPAALKGTSVVTRKNQAESRALESYYRDRFWRQMHRDNQLHLFLNLYQRRYQSQTASNDTNPELTGVSGEPKALASNWDLEAVAELSQYLSKRKVISRYQIDTLKENCYYGYRSDDRSKQEHDAAQENFIVIGSEPKPLRYGTRNPTAKSLPEYLGIQYNCKPFSFIRKTAEKPCKENASHYEYRCFQLGANEYGLQFLNHHCTNICTKGSTGSIADDCLACAAKISSSSNKVFCPKAEQSKDAPAAGDDRKIEYLLPAQLLLWREKQKNTTGSRVGYKYHVSLCGASGPATKALAALLVDEDQKWGIWGDDPDGQSRDIHAHLKRYLPLNTLQTHIRKSFYDKYHAYVFPAKRKKGAASAPQDLDMAYRLSLAYLTTVLPQYFLPFLSDADEKRIHHGMEAFLQTAIGDRSALHKKALKDHSATILSALKDALEQFRGVDALYGVSVSVTRNAENTTPGIIVSDNRSIRDIRLLYNEDTNEPVINCLYVNDLPSK